MDLVLISVVKHTGSDRVRCVGETRDEVGKYRLLSALQQKRAQSRLLYLFYDKYSKISPRIRLNFTQFPKEKKWRHHASVF